MRVIPARWFSLLVIAAVTWTASSGAPHRTRTRTSPKPSSLAEIVRAYRESPSPARKAPVEAYARAHARDTDGALARLALGVVAYEQRDYASAIASLQSLSSRLPQLADYTAFYLGASRVEANELAGTPLEFDPTHRGTPLSPLDGKAWILQARALKASDPSGAAQLLRDHYAALPQPDGDITLADCYQAANELPKAVDFYQRVYYQYPTGDASARAAAALVSLRSILGASYPPPLAQQMLNRADRMMAQHDYPRARSEYQLVIGQVAGLERDLARVRVGEANYANGDTSTAYQYLRGLDLPASEADAERLYYVSECARRLSDDAGMLAAVDRLEKQYPHSPWRFKALVSSGNRFLLVNQPGQYVPLYRAAYQDFPGEPMAASCHWKVTFQAYLGGQSDARELLREQIRLYPDAPYTAAALYFLGRNYQAANEFGAARACYTRIGEVFPNHYYAMPARERLREPGVRTAAPDAEVVQFLDSLPHPAVKPVDSQATPATEIRISRSRLLRRAGLSDLADSELRFGARNGGQPRLLAMEMAREAETPSQGLRAMKSLSADYLDLPLHDAPRSFWELLFPLPFRDELTRAARERNIDPFLLAGLIRQESEFDPQALSRARAYGLTQVLPATGRRYARQAGVRSFSPRLLFNPAANLKIGSSIFRSMLDSQGGNLEETLAAYNAGPNRVAEWATWRTYREPAEFVESIPFTETRDYVQAVLRNADMYRRLYAK
ncbi:MAG TPA: transglycosylase SLT domain-containing protein [Bryobacteraceae bacterium]|nr:transglycosylase SLT domain-containing protein [Bryobacteraceae bacterium]